METTMLTLRQTASLSTARDNEGRWSVIETDTAVIVDDNDGTGFATLPEAVRRAHILEPEQLL